MCWRGAQTCDKVCREVRQQHHHSDSGQGSYGKAFAIGIGLNVIFVVVEVLFGFFADSLALLADAGHNTSDILSLLLAWGAARLARVERSERRTYGLRRTTILASLINAVILLVAIGAIAREAVKRFGADVSVDGVTIMIVAGIGVIINTATALLFVRGRHEDLNIRGAFMHMAADAAVSLGVVVAGLGIHFTGLLWIDPVVSLAIVAVIGIGTWGLLRDSVNLALDAVPAGIHPDEIRRYLSLQPGVSAVHDLHIWAMSTTETALTAHLVRPDAGPDDEFLARIGRDLRERYRIHHVTIQVERGDADIEWRSAQYDHDHT